MPERISKVAATSKGCAMNKPASAPDVVVPPPPADEPATAGDGEGTNAVQHSPDPRADPVADGAHKHVSKTPYTRKV
jgi:hypothetical protein